ncbi:MAG: MATE family efflux transporter [Parasporobacterium sp.]|nr:MATE family efflux transporter [Parasporobacterium sp.]
MNKDMIVGNPTKSLILFAIPMILGQLFQQIYSLADTMIVGRTLGAGPLGAVGSSVSICWVYVSIALGLGIGCSVVISQLFGAERYTRMRTAINTSVTAMLGLSLLFLLIGLLTCDAVTRLMNTPEALFEDARTYYIIYIIGFPGLFLYNISNSIFNALGKSKVPLYFLAGSATLNIGLDLWFILGFHWGVAGAAIATIVSQYLAAILSFVALLRYLKKECPEDLEDPEKTRLFDPAMLLKIARVAVPTMITQTILSVGIVAVQALVNSFGESVMSGYTAASKIDGLAIVPMVQIGNAVSTFAAQNMGARQYDRVVKGFRTALVMTAVVSISLAVVMYLLCNPIVGLFMDASANPEAVAHGAEYVRIVCVFYIIMGFMNNTCGVLRGTGDVMPTMISLLGNFSIRIAFAYVLTGIFHSPVYIWWSQPIGWTIGFLIAYIRFKSGKWKTKSVI